MVHNFQTINSTGKYNEFIFFAFLFFLITILLFGGLLNSCYFFFTFSRNSFLLLAPKVLLIFFLICQLIFPQFGKNIVLIIFDPVFITKYKKKLSNFSSWVNKNPVLVFCFFHALLTLTVLHYFMVYVTGIELSIEIFYQLLNFIKILLLPVLIFCFVVEQCPSHLLKFTEITPESYENLKKTVSHAAEDFRKLSGKYPKSTRVGAGVGIATGGVLYLGHLQQEKMKIAQKHVNSQGFDDNIISQNPILRQQTQQMADLEIQSEQNMIGLGLNSLQRWFSNRPQLSQEYRVLSKQAQNRYWDEMVEKQKKEMQFNTDLLNAVENFKKSGKIQSPTTESPTTESVINYNQGQSSSLIPSPLEDFWTFF